MTAVVAAAAMKAAIPEPLTQAEPPMMAPLPPDTQDFMSDGEPDQDTADTTPVTLLVGARNGFNELGRKPMF